MARSNGTSQLGSNEAVSDIVIDLGVFIMLVCHTQPIDKTKLEIARRDSMIKRLIKQSRRMPCYKHHNLLYCACSIADKDSASEREKLQNDLLNTKNALEDIKKEETGSTVSSQDSVSSPRMSSGDEQVCRNFHSLSYPMNLIFSRVVSSRRDVLQEPGQPQSNTQRNDSHE